MKEHALGLDDPISRRDFLNGVLLTGAGLLLHNKSPSLSPADAFNGYGGTTSRESSSIAGDTRT
jgi:hypothetical protein